MPSLDPLAIPATIGLAAAAILALRAAHERSPRAPSWCFPAVMFATSIGTIALTVAAATNAHPTIAPVLFATAVLLTYAAHRRLRALTQPPRPPDP